MLPRILSILLWLCCYTKTSRSSGSWGFTADALTSSCNVLTSTSVFYSGCYLTGSINVTQYQLVSVTNGQNLGTGYSYVPFHITNDGDHSLPGFVTAGSSYWTTSETPLNCTIACRAHGFKYTMMAMGICGCSTYISLTGSTITQSASNPKAITVPNIVQTNINGTLISDNHILPANDTSPTGYISTCVNSFPGPPNIYCYGDFSQPICGWRVGQYQTPPGSEYAYLAGSTYQGQYAVAIWSDSTYMNQAAYYNQSQGGVNEALNYNYLGCFNIGNPITSLFVPNGFNNTFYRASYCWSVCSYYYMAYSALQYMKSGAPLTCVCGQSFTRNSFQVYPDPSSGGPCSYDPSTGLNQGTCTRSTGDTTHACAGTPGSTYWTVWRNTDFQGCYNPPVPGTQIGAQLYPKACFQGNGSISSSTAYNSALSDVYLTASNSVVTTQPPAVPWGFPNWPNYQYLGCYRAGSMGPSYTNTSNLDGVEQCLDYCYTAGPSRNGTVFVAVSMDYLGPSSSFGCYCGNNMNFLNTQLPAWNCTNSGCGKGGYQMHNSPGLAKRQICGGSNLNVGMTPGPIGLYGPASYLGQLAAPRAIAASTTYYCVPPNSSSSIPLSTLYSTISSSFSSSSLFSSSTSIYSSSGSSTSYSLSASISTPFASSGSISYFLSTAASTSTPSASLSSVSYSLSTSTSTSSASSSFSSFANIYLPVSPIPSTSSLSSSSSSSGITPIAVSSPALGFSSSSVGPASSPDSAGVSSSPLTSTAAPLNNQQVYSSNLPSSSSNVTTNIVPTQGTSIIPGVASSSSSISTSHIILIQQQGTSGAGLPSSSPFDDSSFQVKYPASTAIIAAGGGTGGQATLQDSTSTTIAIPIVNTVGEQQGSTFVASPLVATPLAGTQRATSFADIATPLVGIVQETTFANTAAAVSENTQQGEATGTCPYYPASDYTFSPPGISGCTPYVITWEEVGCTPSPTY